MRSSVIILGSTGSVGRQALEVAAQLKFEVVGLACSSNIDLLLEQVIEHRPSYVQITDREQAGVFSNRLNQLQRDLGMGTLPSPELLLGSEGLAELATKTCGTVLIAVSGFAALPALAAAIEARQRIGLANKEAIVCAGHVFMPKIKQYQLELIPVDSEHSAIWQCLKASPNVRPEKLILTASGGPFYGYTSCQLEGVGPDQALDHPLWSMGQKISLDSASMFNKGLEILEAWRLFGLDLDDIEVVVHPEGLIHSMVAFPDGALICQAGLPDMRLPIQLAFTWPDRVRGLVGLPNLLDKRFSNISFKPVDHEVFPALNLARRAAEIGELGPTVYNAANEVAAASFLAGEISFNQIYSLVSRCLDLAPERIGSLQICGDQAAFRAIIELDAWTRERAKQILASDF